MSDLPLLAAFLFMSQSVQAYAALSRRQNDGDSDSDSDSDSESESCSNNVCTTIIHSGQGKGGKGNGPASQTLSSSATSANHGGVSSTLSLSSQTSVNTSQATTANDKGGGHGGNDQLQTKSSGLSKGGIAGIVIGTVVLAGLVLMMLTAWRRRARRALKRPKGFVPNTFLNPPTHPPATEMSQTDFSTPITSASMLAARTRSPPYTPPETHMQMHQDSNAATSLTPLLPIAMSYNLPASQRISAISTSETTSAWQHEPLHSPYENEIASAQAPNRAMGMLIDTTSDSQASQASVENNMAGSSNGASALHSDMRQYQKALEVDDEKRTNDTGPRPEVNDPPPTYSD